MCRYTILGESGSQDKDLFKQTMTLACEAEKGTVTDWCQEEDFGEIYCIKTGPYEKVYYSSLDARWRTKEFCETLGGEYQE